MVLILDMKTGKYLAPYLGGSSMKSWNKRAYEHSARTPPRKKSKVKVKTPPKKAFPRPSMPKVVRERLMRQFTGYRGKRFKKSFKLYKPKKFSRFGFVKTTEHRDEITSNGTNKRAVYCGHAPAVSKILESFCGAIVIKSFRKQGHKVVSLLDKIQGNLPGTHAATVGSWYLSYKDGGGVLSRISGTAGTDSSYQDVVTQLFNGIIGIDWGGAAFSNPQLMEFYWFNAVDAASVVNNRSGVVNLTGAEVSYEFWSSMKMQNRTPADGGTNTDSMLDIANNPLVGKAYYGNGNGTHTTYSNNSAAGTNQNIIANDLSGFIWWNIDNATPGVITSQMDAVYKKPPGPNGFAFVRKAIPVGLNPGEIRSSYLKMSRTEFVGKFLRRLNPYMDGTSSNAKQCFIGQFALFGWQKKCETPSETSLVTVGIELNQGYKCMIKEKRPSLLHEHQVL